MSDVRVVGLDLSLTSTGMSDGFAHVVCQPQTDESLEWRMARIVTRLEAFLYEDGYRNAPDLVMIEAGAFSRGAQSASAEILAGLRQVVRQQLYGLGIPFAMVTPTGLKAYTAGNGRATKQQMVAAIHDRHGVDLNGWKVKDGRYDVADALALAAMGYQYLGSPLATFGPPPPLANIRAVKWPAIDGIDSL